MTKAVKTSYSSVLDIFFAQVPQPDNAEFDINQTSESCLSVLNNVYNDGIAWVS